MDPAVHASWNFGWISCLRRVGHGLLLVLAALVFTAAIALAQNGSVASDTAPGAGPQVPSEGGISVGGVSQYAVATGSPRDVISSFQRLSAEFKTAMDTYKVTRDRNTVEQIARVLDQWIALIDLSKVPEATRREVGAETAAYLLDIFNRVPLPALKDVPDATAFPSGSPASYLIPNTPFRIVRLDSGPRQGEFLFSENTVTSAPQFYNAVIDLPDRSAQPGASWISKFRQLTGPLVPAALPDMVPGNLKQPVLGTPIWKIAAVVVLTLLAALLVYLWGRLAALPTRGGLVGDRWRLLSDPLAMLMAGLGLRYFIYHQIIVAGAFAEATYATLTLVIFLALAWGFWLLVLAIFETAIGRSTLSAQAFDAHMLRLIARILGLIGATMIFAYGAQDIGLPVFSLLAGLGIGGLAIALAIRPTLENLIGGFILYMDKPIRVGDFCTFGGTSGTVENIGIRSTQVRANDRTLITVPNAQFADMQIVNWAQCDRMLINQTIGLRYETDEDQLRYVIVKLREMLIGHPRIDSETVRVRFSDFGASSLDVSIRVYAVTREWNDFFAIKEDIQFRIMTIVEKSGTGFAFPSQTLYMGRDDGLDAASVEKARSEVSAWRRMRQLPFPNFAESRMEQLVGKVRYPPPGSPDFNATPDELETAGGEPLSAEPLQEESEPLSQDQDAANDTTRR